MKKGLRQRLRAAHRRIAPLNYCPDEEGIKTTSPELITTGESLNYCPDEEGIKTLYPGRLHRMQSPLNYCPDEEGIKTREQGSCHRTPGRRFELLP